jgi:polygalacturonase
LVKAFIERREFLRKATQFALATPVIASFENHALAQTAKSTNKQPGSSHSVPAAQAGPKVTLNVRDFGATGDGKTKDTQALQQTLDRCSVLGGGEVVVPAGDYATGALVLRSNVVLHVEKDASLLGSGDMADYPLA